MERKTQSGNQYGAPSSNGEDQIKEEALKKLYQMQWMRKKKDPHHLARGTERGKREIVRKVQPVTSTATVIPPGYTEETINKPPTVNSWQKKKGSDPVVKHEDDLYDEEYFIFKEALEKDLRTAKYEKYDHGRMRLYNFGIISSPKKYGEKEETWEDEPRKSENSRPSKKNSTKLHFEDTSDSQDETPPTRKHHQANKRQGNTFKSHNKANSSIDEDYDEGSEVDGRDYNYNKEKHISYSTDSNLKNRNLPVTSSKNSYNPQNCATEFVEVQPKCPRSQPIDPSKNPIIPETNSVYAAVSKEPTLPPVMVQSLEQFPYSSPTDILLHKFIRQDPPTNHPTDNVNQHLLDGKHFHSGLPKVESQESLSNYSAQNSPFGSQETYASPGILGRTNIPGQIPFQYPCNLLGNNQGSYPNTQLNTTIASQLPLSTMSPGYGSSNVINSAFSEVGAANPSIMHSFNDPRTNPNMISALGSKIMNPGMVPSFDKPVSNPNVMSSLTHVGNALSLPSINTMANSNLATMQSNPMMDPNSIAGLTNPSTYQNMVSSMDDQSSRSYQAQMLANAGYVNQLQYQNHLAALSNLDTNEALRNTQQHFVGINQSHMLSKDAPKLMSQNSGDSQITGTLHMQSMQDPWSQPNPPLKEFPSQTHTPSQSQGDNSDSTQAELLHKLGKMMKDMAELHKQLKPAEPLSAASLPIPSQQLMYSGQPMMGIGNYYSGMPMLAQDPQPQPSSNPHHPGLYNVPYNRPDITGEPAGLGRNGLP